MPRILSLLIAACAAITVMAQVAPLNTTLLGHLTYPDQLSALRGIAHNNHEYAIVGTYSGLSFVDVTNPTNPTEVFFHPGPQSIWREPYTYNAHAYTVSEGGGGLQMIDMSPLPGSTNLNTGAYFGSTYPFTKGHTMFIDENGVAYIFGADNGVGGAIMLDLSDPMNPVELGRWNQYYVHDGYVRNDTLWAACILDGLAVMVDVSNKQNPQIITQWQTPSAFTHNIWPSADGHYAFTTDEVTAAYVTAYDISNLQNVVEVDRIRNILSQDVIPHNTHWRNGFLINSNYRDGVTIVDVNDPTNMVTTGWYDTTPLEGNGFNGVWEAWPFLPSGNILAGDMELGLFVIGPTYVQACRLKGTVTDASNGNPLNGAVITITGPGTNTTTDIFGHYATGYATAGNYSVLFERAGYLPQTINNVQLINGNTLTLDVQLIPATPFAQTFKVVDAQTNQGIANAQVQVHNAFFNLTGITNASGNLTFDTFYEATYEVNAAIWGHKEICQNFNILENTGVVTLALEAGYADHFNFDLGWSVTSTATAGLWERGVPLATDYNGEVCNPGTDADGDCGNKAYVTGNGGGQAGFDDVDGGETVLTSPIMDFTTMAHPFVRFSYWFFNAGGNGSPNDLFEVHIDNGQTTTLLGSLPQAQWARVIFNVANFISVTNQMSINVRVADVEPGHLVEGGFDFFEVTDSINLAVTELTPSAHFSLTPNPTAGNGTDLYLAGVEKAQLRLIDLTGRTIETKSLISGRNPIGEQLPKGIYLVEVFGNGFCQTRKLVVSGL